jgi:hypothetical protein
VTEWLLRVLTRDPTFSGDLSPLTPLIDNADLPTLFPVSDVLRRNPRNVALAVRVAFAENPNWEHIADLHLDSLCSETAFLQIAICAALAGAGLDAFRRLAVAPDVFLQGLLDADVRVLAGSIAAAPDV